MDLQAVVLGAKPARPVAAPAARGWQLYSRPLALAPGQTLTARACRLGFKDSGTVRYRAGDAGVPAEAVEARPHWRAVADKSGVIERALALTALWGQGPKLIDACRKALEGDGRDPTGTVRYWAVLGLHHQLPEAERPKHVELLRSCRKDESHAVRMAAAEALIDWGHPEGAFEVIIEGLKHPLGSGKLLAATALYHLGEKARPALPAMQKAGGYAGRMAQHIRANTARK
jgi:hypothetical protein